MWKGIAIVLLLTSALAAGGRDVARTPAREPEPPAVAPCDEVELTRREMADWQKTPVESHPRPFGTIAAGRATDW
jgi:hypothetical protein